MTDMKIRKACMEDFSKIENIYAYARKFMAENGNATQWGENYPPEERILQDIDGQKLHVCEKNGEIEGVFYFAREDDPTYHEITEGKWLNDEPYSVVHRVATAEGTKGVATFFMNWAFEQAGNIRIDTHENNIPMQALLKKLGFSYCGKIRLANGAPRIAFQKIK